MAVAIFSLFPQNVYESNFSLIRRDLDYLSVTAFVSSRTDGIFIFLNFRNLLFSLTAFVDNSDNEGYKPKLVQVVHHLMMVECFLGSSRD